MNVEIGRATTVPVLRASAVAERYPQSMEALRLKFYLALLVSDVCALIFGFLVGNVIRFADPFNEQGLTMCVVLLPVYIGIAINSRAYMMDVLMFPRRGMFRAVLSLSFTLGAILLVAFYLHASADFSRIVFGAGTVTGGLAIIVGRAMLGRYARRRFGVTPLSEVIIGDGIDCGDAPDAFRIDAQAAGLRPDINDPLMLDRLGRFLKNADRVIVACPPERREAWALALKGANIGGELISPELDALGAIGTNHYAKHSTMVVSCGPLGVQERVMKRLLDLTVALLTLLFLGPVMVLTALAIKLDSKGPIFFVQERLGRGNRLFRMYKFRSMRIDSCDSEGARSTGRDDDRVTRVGRFIRSTSIDELPQILNVIRGDMSLVGPRPHALGSTAGDKLFWEVDSRYWLRHATKPGLTGLAQVRGFRGATHECSDLTDRLQADLEYLAGWTIWRDLAIMLATFRVLVHRNAF